MRGIKVVEICVVVAVALSAAATAAIAATPELGRCVAAPGKTGEFMGATCIAPAGGKGNHNWLPGPGEKAKFDTIVEEPLLVTSGGSRIKCAFGEGEGEYTGPKTYKTSKLIFVKCEKAGAKTEIEGYCQNIGSDNGKIETTELEGDLGYIEHVEKHIRVGWALKAKSGSIAMFECGGANELTGKGSGTGTLMELQGSVIGRIKQLNKMAPENIVTYKVKSGKQVPENFEGEPADTLTTLVGTEKTAEATVFSGFEEVTYEEALEIKAR